MCLIDAIVAGDMETLKWYLEKGCNPNMIEDFECITPLHYAAAYNRPEAIPLLLTAGADPHRKSAEGLTAIEVALEVKNHNVVDLLRVVVSKI